MYVYMYVMYSKSVWTQPKNLVRNVELLKNLNFYIPINLFVFYYKIGFSIIIF